MITQYRKKVDRLLARYKLATEKVRDEKQHLRIVEEQLTAAEEARKIVQTVAQEVQIRCHKQISRIVSRCLSAVFGENAYEFRIDFEQKRGRTEARLLFVRDGEEIEPTDSCGGGVIDMASLALRLAALVLSRPQKRRLLVLDEPLRCLSRNYAERVGEMLMTLAEELSVQFCIVTHSESLAIGKTIRIGT